MCPAASSGTVRDDPMPIVGQGKTRCTESLGRSGFRVKFSATLRRGGSGGGVMNCLLSLRLSFAGRFVSASTLNESRSGFWPPLVAVWNSVGTVAFDFIGCRVTGLQPAGQRRGLEAEPF